MKVAANQFTLRPGSQAPLFLFHGPDEAASRALARRVADSMGEECERIVLDGAALKGDPARLDEEAFAFSMFGSSRLVQVDRAGDELFAAVEPMLSEGREHNPVVLVAGELRKGSKLLGLIEGDRRAIAVACYPLGLRDGAGVVQAGRDHGLEFAREVASALIEASDGSRGIIERELEKAAAFLDASPEAPKKLEPEVYARIAAGADGKVDRLLEIVGEGRTERLGAEIERLAGEGVQGIGLLRPMLRHMAALAAMRAELDSGRWADGVMKANGIFWKRQASVERQLARWSGEALARAVARLIDAEHEVMRRGGPGILAAEAELFALCRQAERLRRG